MKSFTLAICIILSAILYSTAAFPIAAVGNLTPAVAFDPEMNRYLSVYMRFDTGGSSAENIYGIFIDNAGNAIGDELEISTLEQTQGSPSVAFDRVSRRYLVIWRGSADSSNDIYGQLINQNGTLNGENFPVSTFMDPQLSPFVLNDGVNHKFLAIWQKSVTPVKSENKVGPDFEIIGQLIDNDGDLIESKFNLSNNTADQTAPKAAFSETDQNYLVVWSDDRNADWDIYGRFVDSAGTVGSTDVIISNATGDQMNSSIAWDSANNRYFVAFDDNRGTAGDIYGQLMDSTGTAFGSLSNANIALSSAESDQDYPKTTFDSNAGQFLSAWIDQRTPAKGISNSDIFGQLIGSDGTLSGENFAITSNDLIQQVIAMAFNSNCSNTLIASEDNDTSDGSYDIAYAINGEACSAAPTSPALTYPANEETGVPTSLSFKWTKSTDPDGDDLDYTLYYCENEHFSECLANPVTVAKTGNSSHALAGFGTWFAIILLAGIASIAFRRKAIVYILLLGLILSMSFVHMSCSDDTLFYAVEGLKENTTYYWKVRANDSGGGITFSETQTFTTM